ncbi:MAG: CDP-glycerol glycerophosphotransferase family protein, partial [Bacillota bacterium]|nr:CDP-glycerol glycerophosphotransferase family protein [Bacillota bacterium]
ARLSHSVANSYYCTGPYILKCRGAAISVSRNNRKNRIASGLSCIKSLFKKRQYKVIAMRQLAFAYRLIHPAPVWIFSDRTFAAGDNGETLFRYAVGKNDNARKYFLLDEKSPDYDRMKKFGKVLSPNSLKYKLLFLCSDLIISSHADAWVTNALGKKGKYYSDMLRFRFVFLQHGITKDNLSRWLGKRNKNIKCLITAAYEEYRSFIDGQYGYTENEVKLTGLPRYDLLHNNISKRILIMPTWRKNLAGRLIYGTSERAYNEEFRKSGYYYFYNNLINNKILVELLKKKGFTGELFMHPALKNQAVDFDENSTITVHKGDPDYSREFADGALLLTDYSSVAFDFAYLGKPIVYTQFDRETFFEGHTYSEGYFSYENDGFGPVTHSIEDTVSSISEILENDCVNSELYIERRNSFFAFDDRNNCERVYREIINL